MAKIKMIPGQPEPWIDGWTGPYQIGDGLNKRYQHTLYALGGSGKIYRFIKGGWEHMGGPTSRPQSSYSKPPMEGTLEDGSDPF